MFQSLLFGCWLLLSCMVACLCCVLTCSSSSRSLPASRATATDAKGRLAICCRSLISCYRVRDTQGEKVQNTFLIHRMDEWSTKINRNTVVIRGFRVNVNSVVWNKAIRKYPCPPLPVSTLWVKTPSSLCLLMLHTLTLTSCEVLCWCAASCSLASVRLFKHEWILHL